MRTRPPELASVHRREPTDLVGARAPGKPARVGHVVRRRSSLAITAASAAGHEDGTRRSRGCSSGSRASRSPSGVAHRWSCSRSWASPPWASPSQATARPPSGTRARGVHGRGAPTVAGGGNRRSSRGPRGRPELTDRGAEARQLDRGGGRAHVPRRAPGPPRTDRVQPPPATGSRSRAGGTRGRRAGAHPHRPRAARRRRPRDQRHGGAGRRREAPSSTAIPTPRRRRSARWRRPAARGSPRCDG